MLTVGNNKLTMRDNNDVSLEVAKGGHVQEGLGNSCGWASSDLASWLQFTGVSSNHGNQKMT